RGRSDFPRRRATAGPLRGYTLIQMQADFTLPAPGLSTSARRFFEQHYRQIRECPPMRWMVRVFGEVVDGRYPRLIDLPTGAGKTELAVIWLLALAWYGENGIRRQPVPRRLIWVVNRRILVQQVFNIARELCRKVSETSPGLAPVRDGLRALCSFDDDCAGKRFFEVVELRGQIVTDRDWA